MAAVFARQAMKPRPAPPSELLEFALKERRDQLARSVDALKLSRLVVSLTWPRSGMCVFVSNNGRPFVEDV